MKKIITKIMILPRKGVVKLIRLYQLCISPRIGRHSKYYPTCSEYTRQAVDKYGIIKGSLLGIKRILKCNPFSKGGVDLLK